MSGLEEFRAAREALAEEFGGGMIPFDNAYWDAIHAGFSPAYAQRAGVDALLTHMERYFEAPAEAPSCPACRSVATLPNTKSRVAGSRICTVCGCVWLPEGVRA